MDKKYYVLLTLAVLLSTSFPIVFYWYLGNNKIEDKFIETSYEYENINGAIQPIPRKITIDKDWLTLGKALFHSPLLSGDNTISCASCHLIDHGGDDGFPVSVGVNNALGTRNSPTILNASLNFRQFWDGRASSLEEQISGPIHNPVEMSSSWQEIIPKLAEDNYFNDSFNKLTSDGITPENIIKAITTYEQSLITPNSPIDKFLLGDLNAITSQQKRGLKYFIDYGCATCHQGRNIGGNIYQKLGRLDDVPDVLALDFGRFNITKQLSDKYIFKVPSLRNIADTAPYFHNGGVDNLADAVRIMAKAQLGRKLTDSEVEDIVALLESFSGQIIEVN